MNSVPNQCSDHDLQQRLSFAHRIAVEAGNTTLELFQSPRRSFETKADGSPVTEADRAAEKLLRQRIAETYPDDAILGEEFSERTGTSGWRWVLDPIDGTKSFIHGVPLYGTLVACEFNDSPGVGIIHMPALDETIAGASNGNGWWKPAGLDDRRPLSVTDTSQATEALGLWTCPEVYRDLGVLGVFQTLEKHLGNIRGWSDCYAYVLLVTGRADAVIEAGLKHWDYAAALPILAAAGAKVSNWDGGTQLQRGNILATNGPAHDQILRLIQSAR